MTAFSINSGDYIDAIGIGCSDGTSQSPVGGSGGSNNKILSPGGFTYFTINSGD
jgi:uncharacterized protein YigE (DUF2233 family)